ncbi:MAG: helix-turn-helix domain-containing protein [Clostridia bacterium]|jgi:sugar diacid utilization regulator|nr:helix-turn-helix domain-containing protein [Clostridia bacterium]MDH7572836.1 helix-turn-helix domain-containing protein [Clostridia bacterium]
MHGSVERFSADRRAYLPFDALNCLSEIGRALVEGDSFDRVIERILETARASVGAESAGLLLYDEQAKCLALQKPAFGSWDERLISRYRVRRENGGNAISVFESRKPYVSNNPFEDSRIIRGLLELFPARNVASVPLAFNNRCIGVLHLNNKAGGFTDDDLAVLDLLGSQLASAVETARLVQRCRLQEAQVSRTVQHLKRLVELDDLLLRAALRGGIRAIAECLARYTGAGLAFYDRQLVRRASAGIADQALIQLDQHVSRAFGRKEPLPGKPSFSLPDRVSVFPLHAEGEVLGYLCVLAAGGSEPVAMVERSLPVLVLQLLRERAAVAALRDAESELVSNLLAGRWGPQEVAEKARQLGLALPLPGTVVVARRAGAGLRSTAITMLGRRRVHELRSWLEELGLRSLVAVGREEVVFLLSFVQERSGRTLKQVVSELRARLAGERDLPVCLGVGGVTETLDGVPRSYREARFALDCVTRIGRQEGEAFEAFFDDLGVYRPLVDAGAAAELERLVQGTLGPLIVTDRKKGTSYLRTLYSFFDHGGNLRATAEDLACHLNTVRYRLERTKQLLRQDLAHPECRFNLELAVRLARFFYPELFR